MLTSDQDAYGHLLHDQLQGREAWEVDERDDGFVGVLQSTAAYLAPFAEWPAHQRLAMGHVQGRVLDIGAGGGRHSLYLQEQGHRVLATDYSPLAIKVCKQRGVKHARLAPSTQLSPRLGVFDTLLMLGNNFGLFGDERRARWLLRRFRGLTSPGARLIAESTDPYRTTAPEHLAYHTRNRRRGRMAGQVRMRVRYRTFRTPWFDYLLVSKPEMEGILAGTGWHVTGYLDSSGATYVAVIARA